ncbi:MAG: hypothetical protein H7256_09570 [Bdellovibrio sp.]|nr:hypothetical protein [Bdellovibrio sp.]
MQSDSIANPHEKIHPFAGETVLFATKHQKEEIIIPLLRELGMVCVKAEVDTDQFGTFTGEIERTGSVRETLRKKIKAASLKYPDGRFILASEGSFGPHPIIGFMQIDLESLLLWDRKLKFEIYAEFLDTNPVHGEQTLGPRDDFRTALKNLGFPNHGVIVHPENSVIPIFKGLHREHDVAQAMIDSFCVSTNGRVVVANDLRACHNPTRQAAILEAGKVLLEKLKSFCPSCSYPGYAITKSIPGLPCSDCGEVSQIAKTVLFECVSCKFSEEKKRPDGKKSIEPSECEFCNP